MLASFSEFPSNDEDVSFMLGIATVGGRGWPSSHLRVELRVMKKLNQSE